MRARFGIAPATWRSSSPAKLLARKDPMTLLRASRAMQHRDRAAVVFLGDGELREELEAFVREQQLERVTFAGFVNQTDLPKHYAMCDVFVLPSLYEPRGAVINEAMACGLPVIVTDRCGAIGDIVQDGDNAFVFPAGDARRARRGPRRARRRRCAARADGRTLARDHRDVGLRARRRRREGGAEVAGVTDHDRHPDVRARRDPRARRSSGCSRSSRARRDRHRRSDARASAGRRARASHAWERDGAIRWLRLAAAVDPARDERRARRGDDALVLFLDDDIVPSHALIAAHVRAHDDPRVWAVVGQVLQPGEDARRTHAADCARPSAISSSASTTTPPPTCSNVMAGNLSVERERALAIGGFDENFIGVAYRFETDFALRLAAAGGRSVFEPAASLRHLKLPSRRPPHVRRSPHRASPAHSVGDYYFALQHVAAISGATRSRGCARTSLTRFHLRHPWTIPAKLVGELRGMLLARKLARRGTETGGNLRAGQRLPAKPQP